MMDIKQKLIKIAKDAQDASRFMLALPTAAKNKVLTDMSKELLSAKEVIFKANKQDISFCLKQGCSSAFIDRLSIDARRLEEMSKSLLALTELPDPVGEVIRMIQRPNGLCIHKVRVPIGVIVIIYESRPNVTAECIGLCFKSGNSVILRGGSEALNSNKAIYRILKGVLKKYALHPGAINLIDNTDRQAVDILLKLNNYIDLVIPRGGESLIKKVVRTSRIPVVKHYKGICHVYVNKAADLNMAEEICFNAKVQRPGVCNAMECMLVDKEIADSFLPSMIKRFRGSDVEIRGCVLTQRIAGAEVKKAAEKDYHTEYLALVLSVKVVKDLDEAIKHINYYGSHHSDSIVTEDKQAEEEFLKKVDSACVYVNASTRFTDGYQFGLGAEIGISTDKLHARGPMALEELTTYKYLVFGSGQIRK